MMSHSNELSRLHGIARAIFSEALKSMDAGDAVRRKLQVYGPRLTIFDTAYNLDCASVYSVAIGKAALKMAAALSQILGDRLGAGVIAASSVELASSNHFSNLSLSPCWRVFEGGHPLPNEESFAAARAAIRLVERANKEQALIVFLISGGGSATFELPRYESITLEEVRTANSVMVSCGATIAEINSVRRSFSAVKGGRLAALAPLARQVSLIISDTNRGEESTVASGPTFATPKDAPDPRAVVSRYRLEKSLPPSILRAVNQTADEDKNNPDEIYGEHYLLLDNEAAIKAAESAARSHGLIVEIARDIIEQPVEEGCAELLSQLYDGKERKGARKPFCLISGGEFACPVHGDGTGGRNAETALRCAVDLESRRPIAQATEAPHIIALSAGTDGIDGNSPAAGAIADETTVERARSLGLEAQSFLERSDAYTFFNLLGDTIVTGPTGTNVRDLRIMISD